MRTAKKVLGGRKKNERWAHRDSMVHSMYDDEHSLKCQCHLNEGSQGPRESGDYERERYGQFERLIDMRSGQRTEDCATRTMREVAPYLQKLPIVYAFLS
jgi:hypothetical protein